MLLKQSTVAYTGPFVVFLLFLIISPFLPVGRWQYPLQVLILSIALYVLSRKVIDLRVRWFAGSLLFGFVVCIVWIGPDLVWPGYRDHWLFNNILIGGAESSLPKDFRADWMVLLFRSARSVVLVPVLEELFWRGWLMRWLVNNDFERVPLGTYTAQSFWITALLFAAEHGSYWDVGLLAGIAYNFWMIRTKKLGDCIVAHAITNAALSAYVILNGRWEYWL